MFENEAISIMIDLIRSVNDFIWGYLTLSLLIFCGVYLLIRLRAANYLSLCHVLRYLLAKSSPTGVSPFKALMTALSGTVGTGNIAGIAAAVYLGGPGVLFYMWVIGLLAIVIKYTEGYMAVLFRRQGSSGYYGGPMYYLSIGKKGTLGRVLATLFSICCLLASLGIGSSVQSNSIAHVFYVSYSIPYWLSGALITALSGFVIIGGIKRVSDVASRLVPAMILLYFFCCACVLLAHRAQFGQAFQLIISAAFHGQDAVNGFAGASVWAAFYFGAARGIFSNEAGLGSAAIAHATSVETDPHKQGSIASFGTLIDTFFVCTLTGLVVIVSGAWQSGQTGAAMTALAVGQIVPYGDLLVGIALIFFGFSTILAWGYYADTAMHYLMPKYAVLFRALFLLTIFAGSIFSLEMVWTCADLFNGLMAIPNLIGLLVLSKHLSRIVKK